MKSIDNHLTNDYVHSIALVGFFNVYTYGNMDKIYMYVSVDTW